MSNVEHPKHYADGPYRTKSGEQIECIDITKHMNFCRGNAVKYLWRAGAKDQAKELEDIKKARQYLDFEIERMEVMRAVPPIERSWPGEDGPIEGTVEPVYKPPVGGVTGSALSAEIAGSTEAFNINEYLRTAPGADGVKVKTTEEIAREKVLAKLLEETAFDGVSGDIRREYLYNSMWAIFPSMQPHEVLRMVTKAMKEEAIREEPCVPRRS